MKHMREPVKVDLPKPGREPEWGLFRTLNEARSNLLRIIPDLALEQPIVSHKTFGLRWHMVMDPTAIGEILKDRLPDYPKSTVTKSILEPAIGDSLFIAEGAHWRWQRRAASPVFTHRNIANLGPIMTDAAETLIQRLDGYQGRADMFDEMIRSTFDVIANVTFSGGQQLDSEAIFEAIDAYIEQVAKVSLFDLIGIPKWIPRPSRLFGPDSLKRTKRIADQAIRERTEMGPKDIPDLLDLLMAGQDPKTKRSMNSDEIRDNLLTFIVAGHETTALTLSWAFYLLAFDKSVQSKLREETRRVLGNGVAQAKDCEKLTYTKQVINETLRLYPPAAFLSRTAQAPDTLCGREIKPKDTVMLPVYALHRNKLLWDNPDQFDPSRFAPDQKIERYAFLPFGDGPRICIGAHFAMIEAQIILASLVNHFEFDEIKGESPRPKMIFTLRPEGGVNLQFKRVSFS